MCTLPSFHTTAGMLLRCMQVIYQLGAAAGQQIADKGN
jgi:hypothetical protein